MSKQVQTEQAPVTVTPAHQNNVYVTVTTYDDKGKECGLRVVDMHHVGTRNWLNSHLWWAMHNEKVVEMATSTQADIDDYVSRQEQALKSKYAPDKEVVAA